MSYTRTITENGNSVSQSGGQSFNQQLDALEEQIGEGGGAPAGTGFVKVTDGEYDTPGPLSASDSIWAVATTTRSTNAFSGDLAVAPTLVTGLTIAWRVPSAPSGASTYNLNSLGAKSIYRGNSAAVAADLPANRDIIMRYDGTQWQIIGFGTLTKLDMPFTGTPDGSKYLRDDQTWQAVSATDSTKLPVDGSGAMTNRLTFTGTQTSAGSSSTNGWRDSSGNLNWNVQNGAVVGFGDNGTQRTTIGIKGIVFTGGQAEMSSTESGLCHMAATSTVVQSGTGCLVEVSKLVSRANSTAYGLCPAATGDVLRCKLQDSSSKRAVALVDASGAVTLESGSHADYVASSSPASGEVGVYVTGSVLTIKPGSAGTRAIGAIVERGRA